MIRLTILVWLAAVASAAYQQTGSDEQHSDIETVKSIIDQAGQFYKDGDFAKSALEIRQAQQLLEKIISQSKPPLNEMVLSQYRRLNKAHQMLVQQGQKMKPLVPSPDKDGNPQLAGASGRPNSTFSDESSGRSQSSGYAAKRDNNALGEINIAPDKDPAKLKPAPTSQEALRRTLDAIHQADTEALLALIDGKDYVDDFFKSLANSIKAAYDFREKFLAAYGEDEWQKFLAPPPDDSERPNFTLTVPDIDEIKSRAKEWMASETNSNSFELSSSVTLQFKQIRGGWVVDGNRLFGDRESFRMASYDQKRLAMFIKRHIKAVGYENISGEDIDYQMGRDFFGGIWDNPMRRYKKRFDLKDIPDQ